MDDNMKLSTFAALTIVFLGFYGIFGSLMHYMLPRKRAGEGEVVEEESENNNSNIKDVTVSPPIKKHRISTTDAADLTADNKIVTTGDNSSNYSNTCVDEPSVMASRDVNHNDIDEDLHSRQLAVYGRETMRRLFASNILISGMQGLGAEIAKNLILAGVKSVTLHDEGVVEMWDLSSSFVFSENDVGKNRALASLQKLQELNNAVVISTITTTLTKQKLSDFQFFYFDSVESLPVEPLDPIDFKPLNNRYDAQISVFGSKLQKNLEDAKVFIVGSGALGCEFLKNVALMGVSCGSQGKLTITDDDVIEKSNLSRQFLFRDWNIGQAKSTVAASAAVSINPQLKIEALQNRVGPETEFVFNDDFWENLTVVINALDNVDARLYVDQRCLYFQKPLLESGTLGAKCNTQMVIPHLTENYGASRDPPEKQAPMCTVHSFPHNIDHCLTWARSEFEGLLEKTPAEVNAYLSNPSEYATAMRNAADAQAKDNLERILQCLEQEKCETFQDCVTWARLRFEDYFVNRVKQLTFTFPEDATTSTGAPFWSAPKRFPRPLQFSTTDPSHLQFIMAASILRAETFGIPVPDWVKNTKMLAKAVEKVIVPDFQPKEGVKIETIETDERATSLSTGSVDDAAVINELLFKLERCRNNLPSGFRMKPIQFEKDDDTNYHMDLIAGLANMRARNYSIPEVDKLKAKFIAGRIIPAIATSTAMATGLVCLELYKVLDGAHKVEDYRNTFANLALPLFSMAEPVPPKVMKHRDMSWTVWDRWILRGNPTVRELIQWLKDKGLNAYSISYGSCLLFNNVFPRHKERLDKKVVDVAREIAKEDLPPYRSHLDVVVACEDDEDNDINIPQISIYYR
ncbi:hypothetical protein E1A91_A08G222500v1 [Gossypium mustelinum]|uniref:E1 ubiquitin-activating enzyme n=2 Tax=Gossypium mustelinum TaxID=34275 RepID=A0A5D2YCK8_GOSMU|nr:hypothetical protein E1A91_A08G222500v1 [Gossypium mustelinum]